MKRNRAFLYVLMAVFVFGFLLVGIFVGKVGVYSNYLKTTQWFGYDNYKGPLMDRYEYPMGSLLAVNLSNGREVCRGNGIEKSCYGVAQVLSLTRSGVPVVYKIYLGTENEPIYSWVSIEDGGDNTMFGLGTTSLNGYRNIFSTGDLVYVDFFSSRKNYLENIDLSDKARSVYSNNFEKVNELLKLLGSDEDDFFENVLNLVRYQNVVLPSVCVGSYE